MSKKMTVIEVAERMEATPAFVRMALRQDRLPFGIAVRMDREWRYYISRERYSLWERGLDLMGEGVDENK